METGGSSAMCLATKLYGIMWHWSVAVLQHPRTLEPTRHHIP